jgi:hypothetical protein
MPRFTATSPRKPGALTPILQKFSDQECQSLLVWMQGLLEIKSKEITLRQKTKAALELTAKEKIVWPIMKVLAKEIKRISWDERSTKARFGLAGAGAGITLFGSQGAGIAAFGTAIGVPLWIVLGAGSTFAGVLTEELMVHLRQK